MDDGGLSQTKGVVEETRGEEDGEARSVATARCGQGGDPGGKWTRRREARPAREEVWPYRGPRGTDEARKFQDRYSGGVSVLIWTDDRTCDLAPPTLLVGRLISSTSGSQGHYCPLGT